MFRSLSVALILSLLIVGNVYAVDNCQTALQPVDPILRGLYVAANAPPANHKLVIKGGKALLKIGKLRREQVGFNKALKRAVESNLVEQIDTGLIIGGKVLPLLRWIQNLAIEKKANVSVVGKLNYSWLRTDISVQRTYDMADQSRAYKWNDREFEDVQSTIKHLRIEEACVSFFGPNLDDCQTEMYFKIDGNTGDIQWTIHK